MNIYTCIEKIRDKSGKIIQYKLEHILESDKIIYVLPNELKDAMKRRDIAVSNLKLTADNRLIDKNTVPEVASEKTPEIALAETPENRLLKDTIRGINIAIERRYGYKHNYGTGVEYKINRLENGTINLYYERVNRNMPMLEYMDIDIEANIGLKNNVLVITGNIIELFGDG